jgi:cyclophilin family peptidyl-prolyl cis-trans isomerase
MKPATLIAIIAVLLIPVVALGISLKSKNSTTVSTSPTPTTQQVVLQTVKGDITINLYPSDAPKTVENFVELGKKGYFNGTYFHRILKDFVIQGGDPTGTGTGGESIFGGKFADEINSHKIVQGTVAMANAGPNTNGSQFFIVTKSAQPSLDGSYTVFGQIDPASQSVVDALAAVAVNNASEGRPVNTDDAKITGFIVK